MKSHTSYSVALGGPTLKHAAMAVVLLLAAALLAPRAMAQSIFLDPNNPFANFVKEGNQSAVPGAQLALSDSSANDHVGFYAATTTAAEGQEVEVTAMFRLVTSDSLSGVDTGWRLVITDGAVTSFIVGCITLGGLPGVAIAVGNSFAGADNYAAFVPVDWLNTVTLTLRRHADGSGEIIEVNGVAPLVPALAVAASLPGPTRGVPSVGFGLFTDAAITSAEINSFSAVAVTAVPEPETYAMLLAGLGLLGFAARRRKLMEAAAA